MIKITHTLPLEKTAKGIEILRRGEGIEILVDPRLKPGRKGVLS